MWCPHCQQDVPAVASSQHKVCCARCGDSFSSAKNEPEAAKTESGDSENAWLADLPPSLEWEDWQLEEDLRAAERLLRNLRCYPPRNESAESPCRVASFYSEKPAQRKPSKSGILSRLMLAFGLTTFSCGGILLGWSVLGERPELWNYGLPTALVGQAGLLIGLILQLDGLWQNNRQATHTLEELDDQVHQLRHAATLASSDKSSQSFYAHVAEGAHPELLLADLKGQLDLLAQQIRRSA